MTPGEQALWAMAAAGFFQGLVALVLGVLYFWPKYDVIEIEYEDGEDEDYDLGEG